MSITKKTAWVALLGTLFIINPAQAQKYVCMESTQGQWCMRLLPEAAPKTVANFLLYVESGRYARSMVHRSMPNFVIQGGGFEIDEQGGSDFIPSFGTVVNEFNRSNVRGTVAMAKRGGDPDSATNQWFINLVDNSFLDEPAYGAFTVFAEVVHGMDVVDKIAGLRVEDMSFAFGPDFTNMPLDLSPADTTVELEDIVIITRAYTADLLPGQNLLPYHCTPDVPAVALTELCGNEVIVPVSVDGIGYEATLQLTATQPQLTFVIKPGSMKPLATLPAGHATFNAATMEVLIPSVRQGASLFGSIVLKLSSGPVQQFTLQSFEIL